jgi:hypothetical protein
MFWTRRKLRVEVLEHRLDRIAIRQCVSEIMVATTIGFVLRSVGGDLRRQILTELRKNVRVSASSFSNPMKAEAMALEMEERVDQLLDQVEHLARV